MSSKIGPWLGVRAERQHVCAVYGCKSKGKPQRCYADDRMHHHGCVHYTSEDAAAAHLRMRKGWALLCDDHYEQLERAHERLARARAS